MAVLGLAIAALGPARAERARAARLMPAIAGRIITPQQACKDAVEAAEQAHGIPHGFLLAIARVESGRRDGLTGLTEPWPWTVDVAGKGSFLESRSEAMALVSGARQDGTTSIDVGCLQVNLQQHPDAFASLDEAFDPAANADYAARFLLALWRESGDWSVASGLYHSRTVALAEPYRNAVAARFAGAGGTAPSTTPAPAASPVHVLAAAWAATMKDDDSAAMRPLWPKPRTPAEEAASLHVATRLRLTAR